MTRDHLDDRSLLRRPVAIVAIYYASRTLGTLWMLEGWDAWDALDAWDA